MEQDRRTFLRQAGLGLIAVGSGVSVQFLSPAEARASRRYVFTMLSGPERATLAAAGEVLLPGCVAEGLCEFIDYHLSVDSADCLLLLRYLVVPPPYADFYRGSLAALDTLSRQRYEADFKALDGEQQNVLIGEIGAGQPAGWQGPPAPLFYFALRSDAVDVYYGTEKGFDRLGIPYMAHIPPPTPW